jgi:hypothetical protein
MNDPIRKEFAHLDRKRFVCRWLHRTGITLGYAGMTALALYGLSLLG